jgi:hypothetical protein
MKDLTPHVIETNKARRFRRKHRVMPTNPVARFRLKCVETKKKIRLSKVDSAEIQSAMEVLVKRSFGSSLQVKSVKKDPEVTTFEQYIAKVVGPSFGKEGEVESFLHFRVNTI